VAEDASEEEEVGLPVQEVARESVPGLVRAALDLGEGRRDLPTEDGRVAESGALGASFLSGSVVSVGVGSSPVAVLADLAAFFICHLQL